jgi:RimJ/RimL family protein N-acetyltransferase
MTLSAALDIPVIETERLILRAPRVSDLEAMLAFNASPRSGFLGGGAPRQAVWRALLANIGHWAVRGFGFWTVENRAGEIVGRVGVIDHDEWPEPELGWHLFDGHEGRGYALEAALAARTDAQRRLGLPPLMSLIDPANARSIALALRMGAVAESETIEPNLRTPVRLFRHPRGTE